MKRGCNGTTMQTCPEFWLTGHTSFHIWIAAVLTAIGEGKRTGKKHRVKWSNNHWRVEEVSEKP